MNNKERYVEKIEVLRILDRVTLDNGKILVTTYGDCGLFYNKQTGKVYRADLIDGQWKIGEKEIRCNSSSKYCYTYLPRSGFFQVAVHVIGAVLYGMFDNIEPDLIMYYQVNHKDYDTRNNRIENLEVVLDSHNASHRSLHSVLKKHEVYKPGMAWNGEIATYLLSTYRDDLEGLLVQAGRLRCDKKSI